MRARRFLAITISTATVAALGTATGTVAGTVAAHRPGIPALSTLAARVAVHPNVIVLTRKGFSGPPTTAQCRQAFKIPCYGATQIEQAYGLPQLYKQGTNGAGQTIVIVDSFGSPTIRQDLAAFDKGYGLPAPPSFKIIQPAGPVPPFHPNGLRINWAAETSLDVEYSHAIAPGANILLVESPTAETEGTGGFPQIVTAEEFVIKHHLGTVISQSFGATEQSFSSPQALFKLRTPYLDAARKGITVLASTGDFGAANVMRDGATFFLHRTISWPSSDPLVTALGGTQLHLDAKGNRTSPDTVWNDTYNKATLLFLTGSTTPTPIATGGGKSADFALPSYQSSALGGQRRGVPDISMSAACDGSVNVHIGVPGLQPGFYQICGTSEASPEFAGIVALAAQVAGHSLGPINPALYAMLAAHAPGIVDVTSGNNSVQFSQNGTHRIRGFAAGPGYDLASGVGTVWAPDFVPELAQAAG